MKQLGGKLPPLECTKLMKMKQLQKMEECLAWE